MELRQIQYFLAVAEELNFNRAAERLAIAQPPLSRQIRQLEDELGVELFRRIKRRVELTEAGRAFLEEARQILARVEQGVRVAQRASRGEIGQLVVGFEGSSTYDVIPMSLKVYRERFPEVDLVVYAMTTEEQIQALLEGRIGIGFGLYRLNYAAPDKIADKGLLGKGFGYFCREGNMFVAEILVWQKVQVNCNPN